LQAKLTQVSFLPNPCRVDSGLLLCVCLCMFLLALQVSSLDSNHPWVCVVHCEEWLKDSFFCKSMKLVPFATDLLGLCKLLPCTGSKLFFRYPRRIMDVRTWFLGFLHWKCDFCISGPMNARLSVHGSLKRAKRREDSSVRSRVRLSELAPFA